MRVLRHQSYWDILQEIQDTSLNLFGFVAPPV